MTPENCLLMLLLFLYGIVIGSFLNVYIFRNNTDEKWYRGRSHCMSCGHTLSAGELIPVFSFLFLRGRCKHCKAKISVQYPIVELASGVGCAWIGYVYGYTYLTVLYCITFLCLLALSVIDLRTYEIPDAMHVWIGACGLIALVLDRTRWPLYVIGFFAVSVFLYLIYLVTKGRGIGGGDIKLMAAAGLLLGWQKIIVALFLGCILGSVIHLLRMKLSKAEHVLAFGPYLSLGIFLTMIWGDQILQWYIGMLTF